MTIEPVDLPQLIQALAWPLVISVLLVIYRCSIFDFIKFLGKSVHKVSFAGASIELAEVSEISAKLVDTEIRELNSSFYPNSGATGITNLLSQIQHGGQHDYIVIDLGDKLEPRWLTSRLYLTAFLASLVSRSVVFVFVETSAGIRKRFIGTASAMEVRWALARSYPWLETASASSYAQLGDLQFDPASGNITDWQTSQILNQFISKIQIEPIPPLPPNNTEDWVLLNNQKHEHAKWLDGARLERVLGGALIISFVIQQSEESLNKLVGAVLKQRSQFVAIVDQDKRFRSLVDRMLMLEKLALKYSNQVD